jgi:hypothetical protein
MEYALLGEALVPAYEIARQRRGSREHAKGDLKKRTQFVAMVSGGMTERRARSDFEKRTQFVITYYSVTPYVG